jgi:hypothetical protein
MNGSSRNSSSLLKNSNTAIAISEIAVEAAAAAAVTAATGAGLAVAAGGLLFALHILRGTHVIGSWGGCSVLRRQACFYSRVILAAAGDAARASQWAEKQ